MTAVSLGLFVALPVAVPASEESQRLVERGEATYDSGRYDEAERLFEEAVAADGQDADAHHRLGLVLVKLERWQEAVAAFERALALRPDFEEARRGHILARALAIEARPGVLQKVEEAAEPVEVSRRKPWEAYLYSGAQYDDNVALTPDGQPVAQGAGEAADAVFILGAGGHYDLLNRDNALFRIEYDIYQNLHTDITDFDFRSHSIRGTASRKFRPYLWAGIQGGYEHYSLGGETYRGDPYVKPFISILQGSLGLTQFIYRHADATYFQEPFSGQQERDGPIDVLSVNQVLFLAGGAYLNGGFLYAREAPRDSAGDDWRFDSYQGFVGFGVPGPWETAVDVRYIYRYDDYTKKNSFAGFRKGRNDNFQQVYVGVARRILGNLTGRLELYSTINDSNINVFQYTRNQLSMLLEYVY